MQSPRQLSTPLLQSLFEAGLEVWHEHQQRTQDKHNLFIPCDYEGLYVPLRALKSRAHTFVEFGSGSGVATILADLLGFEAYGVEIDPWLVDQSIALAERFDSRAVFVEGTFVAADYAEAIEHLSSETFTTTSGSDAFEELGMELSCFDVVFAYPWPGEEEWTRELVRKHGRTDTLLLTYDVTEGFRLDGGEFGSQSE